MSDDLAIEAANAAFRKAETELPAAWEDPYGYTAEVIDLVVAVVKPIFIEECAEAIEAAYSEVKDAYTSGFANGMVESAARVRALAGESRK